MDTAGDDWPGTSFLYSNSNYGMLSIVVRKVTGKSLRAYADEVLFQPLGMRNTHYHDNRAEPVTGRVIPYAPVGQSFRVDGDTSDNLLAPGAPAVVNGALRLISRTAEGELRASGNDRFTWSSWTFSFERDGSGRVSGYRLDGTRAKGVKYARVE